MQHFLDGVRLVFGQQRYWRYIAAPLALSAAIFLVLALVGLWVVSNLWHGVAARLGGGPLEALGPLLYLLVLFFTTGFVMLTITAFASSLWWERLSAVVEGEHGGFGGMSTLPRSTAIADSIMRGSLAIGVALTSLCCNFLIPGVIALLLAGWMGLLDYTSPAYLRRDVTLGKQIGYVFKLPGAIGFFAISGLVTLIPLLNVVLLPALVAGGTLMVMRGEKA